MGVRTKFTVLLSEPHRWLLVGMTRKFIGATFEGETKDADGGMWAECELEGDV